MTNNQTPTTLAHRATTGAHAAIRTVTILPAAIADVVTVVSPQARHGRAGRGRLAWFAVRSVLLGLVAWVLAGIVVLMIARGALYGIVDPGPYDDAWGGPTRAGAWLEHFVISLPFAVAATLLLAGIARVHRTMTAGLDGAPVPRWVTPVVLVAGAAATLFVVAWTRQI